MLQGRGFGTFLGGCALLAAGQLLAAENPCEQTRIDKLELVSPKSGYYQLAVDYCYKPDTHEPVFLTIALDPPEQGDPEEFHSFPWAVSAGQHRAVIELNRPATYLHSFNSHSLQVQIVEGNRTIVAVRRDQVIEWPTAAAYERQRIFARYSNDELIKRAERLIDDANRSTLETARAYLEKVVLEEPDRVMVYKQFARIAMLQHGNAQGWQEARGHLDTALLIQPDYADGYILRGFVLAHLQLFDEAEADFRKAESLGVQSLWLWNNWARKELLQGNKSRALELYRRTLAGDPPKGRNMRARTNAFEFVLDKLGSELTVDEVEALHVQRLRELDNQACLYTEYAAFLLRERKDYAKAIEIGHKSLDSGCRTEQARATLGLAYHMGSLEKPELAGRARVFLPEGAVLYWELAKLPAGEPLLQRSRGRLDTPDSNGYTALAYALVNGQVEAARRLMAQGASPAHEIGAQRLPLILLPILHGSPDGVRFLIDQGIDYTRVEYRGIPALGYAQQGGNEDIIGLLNGQRKI